jgi:hypothetical protein
MSKRINISGIKFGNVAKAKEVQGEFFNEEFRRQV